MENNFKEIKAVLFDLDCTLTDTMEDNFLSWEIENLLLKLKKFLR